MIELQVCTCGNCALCNNPRPSPPPKKPKKD